MRARNRLRRQAALALTPEERLARQAALTEALFAQLRSNPEAWPRFLRRNYKKRAGVTRMSQLELLKLLHRHGVPFVVIGGPVRHPLTPWGVAVVVRRSRVAA